MMDLFKNPFKKTSQQATEGSHQEMVNISEVSEGSSVAIRQTKAKNYIEGNNSGNIAGRDIINNYYGTNSRTSKEELTRAMNSYLEWLAQV